MRARLNHTAESESICLRARQSRKQIQNFSYE